jgi:protocatechuate 3,4-dioxygenase beta subunit
MATRDKMNDDSGTAMKMDRRDVITALGALGPLLLLACSSSDTAVTGVADASGRDATDDASGTSDTGAATSSDAGVDAPESDASASTGEDAGACHEIPDETGGPYPDVDGMISNATYHRQDITEGLKGTPLTLTLQLLDVSKACAPIVGARVIIWHCDANGVYSEYASAMNSDQAQDDIGLTTTTYLRGWQVTDSNGRVTFTTLYPGWYLPRVTHIHVMVYNPSDLSTPVKTTQFAFPDVTNATVYDQATLYAKGQNSTTNATDQVFGNSDEYLVAAVTGNTTSGYAASLPVGLELY